MIYSVCVCVCSVAPATVFCLKSFLIYIIIIAAAAADVSISTVIHRILLLLLLSSLFLCVCVIFFVSRYQIHLWPFARMINDDNATLYHNFLLSFPYSHELSEKRTQLWAAREENEEENIKYILSFAISHSQ